VLQVGILKNKYGIFVPGAFYKEAKYLVTHKYHNGFVIVFLMRAKLF